jgi:pyruvate/2-oxoglutarate dehydrogenase complex dihydrolipoamide acyltransferase (E2) component
MPPAPGDPAAAPDTRDAPPVAFLLTPFSARAAGDEKPATYRAVQRALRDAARDAGVELRRADSIFRAGVIVDQVREAIEQADLVIAVCTGKNANVFYELGLAEALGHVPILIAPDASHLPFDKAHCRCHMYGGKRQSLKNLRQRLAQAILETLEASAR